MCFFDTLLFCLGTFGRIPLCTNEKITIKWYCSLKRWEKHFETKKNSRAHSILQAISVIIKNLKLPTSSLATNNEILMFWWAFKVIIRVEALRILIKGSLPVSCNDFNVPEVNKFSEKFSRGTFERFKSPRIENYANFCVKLEKYSSLMKKKIHPAIS